MNVYAADLHYEGKDTYGDPYEVYAIADRAYVRITEDDAFTELSLTRKQALKLAKRVKKVARHIQEGA